MKRLAEEEVESPLNKRRIGWELLSSSLPKREHNDPTREHQSVLLIPRLEDNPDEIISKLIAITEIICSGKSIAEATAYSAAPSQNRKAVEVAVSQMTIHEQCAWEPFVDGSWCLPELDWDSNKLPPPSSAKGLKIARRRAEGLNRLYKTDRAHEGHIVWITENQIMLLHLIKAMTRVIGVEKNFVGGCDEWSATQFADLQSINRILSILGQICARSTSKMLRSKIAEVQQMLGIHRQRLQALSSKKAT